MKVVLILPSFPKLSETFIVSKYLGLLEQEWDVHVVCNASDSAARDLFPELGRKDRLRRIRVAGPHHPRWLAAVFFPVALARALRSNPRGVARYLRRGWRRFGMNVIRRFYLDAELISLKPALIHFEFGSLAVERMYLRDMLGCRVVVSFRGYDINFAGLEDRGYYNEVWENADALHFLGEDLWRRALGRNCPPESRHEFIAPAIDARFFDAGARKHDEGAGGHERPLRILSVGRLEWKKGYEFALQAVALLERAGVRTEYRIIGEGEYLEAIAFGRHQLKLERVELMGARTRSEVRRQMLRADVFLHPAVSEGFCNAVMEAAAMALPVVCTDADGLAENVADGWTGFVVPRRDPEALAEKLGLLARNPELRQRMGRAGRERVQTLFGLERQITGFSNLYSQVLSREA